MIDQPTQIRKGEELNIDALQSFLAKEMPQLKGDLSVLQFPSGFSNLTYMLQVGEKSLVLRRPPFGAKIKSGHDMGREFKILSSLIKEYSKVPKPYVYTEDESIIGAPFYIMEKIEGVILRGKLSKEMRPAAAQMTAIADSLIDTFVELHAVDYNAVGLSNIGRPEGYITRQIVGWTKRYMNAKTDEIPKLEKAAKWLNDHLPKETQATLIHNDFKYDNLLLDANDWTRVKVVLDWEMATVGDPLMDLGTSVGYWTNHDDPDFLKRMNILPTALPGNPTREEFVHQYALKSGRNVDNILFYYVYGIFKICVILQQIYYRYKKGHTQDERFKNLIDMVKTFGELADRAIDKKRLDGLF